MDESGLIPLVFPVPPPPVLSWITPAVQEFWFLVAGRYVTDFEDYYDRQVLVLSKVVTWEAGIAASQEQINQQLCSPMFPS